MVDEAKKREMFQEEIDTAKLKNEKMWEVCIRDLEVQESFTIAIVWGVGE
jgi:hypothetical protein